MADFHLAKLKYECLLPKMAHNLFEVMFWRGPEMPNASFRWRPEGSAGACSASWWELIVKYSGISGANFEAIGGLKLAGVGFFTPWEWASTADWAFGPFSGGPVDQHTAVPRGHQSQSIQQHLRLLSSKVCVTL